ncbi:MAG TPA: zinc ribbon domain-containing protein [Candidatus Lokiarchaeia archaeon]
MISIEFISLAYIYKNVPYKHNWNNRMELGYLSLYEDNLSFEFKKDRSVLTISISDIQNVLKKTKNAHTYLRIVSNGDIYSFELIKKRLGKFRNSRHDVKQLNKLLFKCKFKDIAHKSQEKYPICNKINLTNQHSIKPSYCFECGKLVRDNANYCHNCGYQIKFVFNNLDPNSADKQPYEVKCFKSKEKLHCWKDKIKVLKEIVNGLDKGDCVKHLISRKSLVKEKITCLNCNNFVEVEAEICPYCGIELQNLSLKN